MKVMMMMNYEELKKGRIYEAIKLTLPGLYNINKYRIEDSMLIPVCCETCKREGLKRDPTCCMCDVKGDYANWQWSVAKTKMLVEIENKMPELNPGMVVSGKFKNDNGGKEEYKGILLECDNSLFVSYATVDGRLKYISDIKHDEIDKIYKMKRPSIFTAVLADDNLETIWERKPPIDWNNVATDTKVLVRESAERSWGKRYFAYCDKDNKPLVWVDGQTSFTAHDGETWKFDEVVLYEGNEHLIKE